MKNKVFTLITASVVSLLILGACRQESARIDFESLPELPQDIAATLDPNTMATKTAVSDPAPVKEPGVAAAPCCSITDRMELQVRYAYTKCGPLRDFIVAPLENLMLSADTGGGTAPSPGSTGGKLPGADGKGSVSDLRVFKLKTFNGRTVLDQQVCFTSSGPWKASFSEERRCNNYTPIDSLLINAFGDVVSFVWSGGTPNHPANVQLVSCRQLNTTRSPCGDLSSCDCTSSSCPQTQPCECNLQGW